ncbi:TetR/AcrR family transcriptional regulator [Saccharospirillum mangrovi]|uniref:TetR/AcrR family transcriptional regulator n=1 Tax=Saccharospirillum mangrovi TaxID=2161747 RepID=UPI000D367002|nr:TetR/AcrR family transcriptional regulator [Saccharospirillum mangrovi]
MTEPVIFYKEAFAKTSEQRRKRVLDVAVREFAEKGFAGTNINVIADEAGISIGAMYSYFTSKEALFLTIVSQQFTVLTDTLNAIDVQQSFDQVIRELFRQVMVKTQEYRGLSQIFHNITTQSMAGVANKLSNQFEADVLNFLLAAIESAKARQEIPQDTDVRMLAFCIDNLLIMFQFSFSSDYYRERMRLFLGDERVADGEQLVDDIMRFIHQQTQ